MLDIQTTDLEGVLLITPKRFADARGFFSETFNAERFRRAGVADKFVQDNQSYSRLAGTVRGLHYQAPPRGQAKLVRVLKGAIIDVAVDARKNSPTYGRHVRARLSAENGAQLFVPCGFLHGFATLEADTEVAYKVSDFYSADHDGAVLWNDPALAIDWGIDPDKAVLSEKDAGAVSFANFNSPF
ncbi:MAG: dTDP-4-dehydrorhamnose 3,5-epimerase [Parvularculaceae bacterium]|nr:dTDP-4-dehydrorhamnose 3,5-epimerase [Parvularculaceae bacterium]